VSKIITALAEAQPAIVTHHLIRNKFLRSSSHTKLAPGSIFLRSIENMLSGVGPKSDSNVFPISKTICETPRAELFFGGEKEEKAAAGAANIEDELRAWAPNYIFCACRQQADRRLERVSEKHLTQCHCVCSSLSAIGTWPCIIHAPARALARAPSRNKKAARRVK
jgi:hypothetical protein